MGDAGSPAEDGADASIRVRQILEVLEEVRGTVARGEPIHSARRKATKSVAERRGIAPESVSDACSRQLEVAMPEFDRL